MIIIEILFIVILSIVLFILIRGLKNDIKSRKEIKLNSDNIEDVNSNKSKKVK